MGSLAISARIEFTDYRNTILLNKSRMPGVLSLLQRREVAVSQLRTSATMQA